MTKQQLRTQYLNKRQALSREEYAERNQQLLKQFQQLNLLNIKCIHLFLPMYERNEPDTGLIRDWLKAERPEIKIVFPKSDFRTATMKSYADDNELQLAKNQYGTTEPTKGTFVDVSKIDIVILPLLIFDEQGYRVGYGKGFYDRFCVMCKPGTRFIGLSLFDPVKSIEDINQYDVKMHACLTPTEKWEWQHKAPVDLETLC